MLMLSPSRVVLAYNAALSAQALVDMGLTQALLQQTAAVDPEYKDVRHRMALLSRPVADPAMWRGGSAGSVIALTFDDGPKPGLTEQLLAALTRDAVPATFFVIGRHATAYPNLMRMIADSGMQIE